ncbi:hypothetical protein QQ045_000547 [Rhodiola kirilowii]
MGERDGNKKGFSDVQEPLHVYSSITPQQTVPGYMVAAEGVPEKESLCCYGLGFLYTLFIKFMSLIFPIPWNLISLLLNKKNDPLEKPGWIFRAIVAAILALFVISKVLIAMSFTSKPMSISDWAALIF